MFKHVLCKWKQKKTKKERILQIIVFNYLQINKNEYIDKNRHRNTVYFSARENK